MSLSKAESEKLSKVLLEDRLVSVLLHDGRPLRTPELVQRSSNGVTLSREYLRQELTESNRIVFSNRKWNLRSREDASHRPIEGMLEETLRVVGGPLDAELLAHELASVRGKSVRYYLDIVPRILDERPKYVQVHGEVYLLEDWLLETATQDENQIIIENFLDKDPEFASVRDQLGSRRFTGSGEPSDWIIKILESVGSPVHHRIVSFLIWKELYRQFDPSSVWRALYDDERLTVLSSGHCLTVEMKDELEREIARKASQIRRATGEDRVIDVAALLKKKLSKDALVVLSDDDVQEVISFVKEMGRPVTLPTLLNNVFDLSGTDPEYPGTLQALSTRLGEEGQFEVVGPYQYLLKDMIPEFVHTVPDILHIERVSVRNANDEEVDVLLEDAGLEGNLAEEVTTAAWEDIDEEYDVARVPKTRKSRDSVRYAVPYHHFLAGTMKYRELDDEFFGMETPLMYVILVDDSFGEVPVWISEETGLIHGLEGWYQQRLEPCGSVLQIFPTEVPAVFKLVHKNEKDPLLHIPLERIEELKSMRNEAASKPMSVFDLMCRLLTHHGRGVEFITLWSEVNIVRRTSKRMIASILSGYHCFYQPAGKSPTFFAFDERRLDQGFNGKKRRYIKQDEMM